MAANDGYLRKPTKVLGDMSLHYVDDIAIIVIGSGQNRLNTVFLNRFLEFLDDIESNTSCKGVITTGKGKFYSNGLDLAWLTGPLSAEELQEFGRKMHEWLMRVLLFPLPTLAAINGHAYAGGALLAFAHDFRVQNQEKGWLCFNEVWIGRQFAKFHYLFLSKKMSNGNVYSDAIVLGKKYTAQEGVQDKLVHRATPASRLLSESIHLLKSFYGKSGYPRESLHLMKRDVYSDAVQQQEIELASMTQGLSDAYDTFSFKSKL